MLAGQHSSTLAILSRLALVLLVAESIAETHGSFSRPFKSIYEKTRSLRHRTLDRISRGNRIKNPPPQVPSGTSVNARSSRSSDENVPSDGSANKAMCVFSRGPSLKNDPALFYFSAEINAGGCEVEVEIELSSSDHYKQLNETAAKLSIRNKLINTRYYDSDRPTYFITHGFLADWKGNWLCDVKDMILSKIDANVFIVDWSGGSKPMVPIDYGASVSNTPYVANLVSQFIKLLLPMTGQLDAQSFHLIGHSLGAHISGFVGYALETVGQITALDPAGPCFTTSSESESESAEDNGLMHKGKRRLSPQSAHFVLALHTDTGLFGLNENCAHYDVYVNGGVKQPKCGAVGPLSRLDDLLHLNLGSTFNLNLACRHSYAHKLLDTFVDFSTWRGWPDYDDDENNESAVSNREQDQEYKCYPMAYQCLDWKTFRAGECGFCLDNDTRCVFTGISLYNYQRRKSENDAFEHHSRSLLELKETDHNEDDDDDEADDDIEFNNEHDESHGEDDTDEGHLSAAAKYGQHFMRAAADHPVCMFHYQILIAARRGAKNVEKHYYYLHIPLENGGRFHDKDGKRLHDRLVQVSHRIEPDSPVHSSLMTTYRNALSNRLGGADGLRNDDIEFYSALITFKQAPAETCATPNDETNGAATKDKWQLCNPLNNIQEARLWSSSEDKLDAVSWVSMNYMSGLSFDERMSKSYALLRYPNGPIKKRDEIEQSDRAKLGGLTPRMSNGIKRSVRGVTQAADCFLSLLDVANIRDSRRNYRCRRSSSELKYAIDLKPHKL
uniref:Endothelial lipase n=1 Tax=Aceria tosichella TaxID=561515 RepID=A0A6G1SA21_9ACAR